MEPPDPQQFGRDDEDEVAAAKQAFAEYTAVAGKVHAALYVDDAEGRAAKEAVRVSPASPLPACARPQPAHYCTTEPGAAVGGLRLLYQPLTAATCASELCR